MMPLRCRECKLYVSVFKKEYHGVVEGCMTTTRLHYPICFVSKVPKVILGRRKKE